VNTIATAVSIHAIVAGWISAAVSASRTNATGNSVDMVALPQWTPWISRQWRPRLRRVQQRIVVPQKLKVFRAD
jgi:hypothetical protein